MGRHPISTADKRRRQIFGALLQNWREQTLELGLREAARAAGLDHTTLSRIESGERPALEHLPRLERAYKVPLESLRIAYSGQLSLAMSRSLFKRIEPARTVARKTELFSVRTTPEEKRELTIFLGYLRFAHSAERSHRIRKSSGDV